MSSIRISNFKGLLCVVIVLSPIGCVGRTGKIGQPIADRYHSQIDTLKVGQSTPEDLKAAFKGASVSMKEVKHEAGREVQIWEVFRGGNMDAGAFILWGQIAHDKDQSILFRFENGRLASYESVIHEDPPTK